MFQVSSEPESPLQFSRHYPLHCSVRNMTALFKCWEEEDNIVCPDENLVSSSVNLVSMDDDSSSLGNRPETDEDNGTPPTDLTGDHPKHCEVHLAHDSVKGYLVSERIKRTDAAFYSISEGSSNEFLARSCFAYLMPFKGARE